MPSDRSQKRKNARKALHEERYFIDKALAFANSVLANSVEEAEELLLGDFGIQFEVEGPSHKWLEAIHREQGLVRHLLAEIVEDPTLSQKLRRTINRLWLNNVGARPQLGENGQITFTYAMTGITDAARLGVALLFPTGLAARLRKCGQCGNFLLAEGQATRTQFCPGECAKLNELEKSRERRRRSYQRQKQRKNRRQ